MSASNAAAHAKVYQGGDLLDTESALVLAGVVRADKDYWDERKDAPRVRLDDPETLGGLITGSEAEYRPYEVVCPVTWLTYHKDLKVCPNCDGECGALIMDERSAA